LKRFDTARRVRALAIASLSISALAAGTAAIALVAGPANPIAPFSSLPPGGAFPATWKPLGLPQWKSPEFALVADQGVTVLRARADAAAGSLVHALDADATERPILAWRWKVDRVVEKGDIERKAGDDFAARVYVYFDVPAESLPFTARAKLRLARLYYGMELPAATICYVWDNRKPVGTSVWNAFTDRVRMVVLESGNANAGHWVEEQRDLDADFRAAFGVSWPRPTPHIKGIALGNDTDQTKETVTAWFGDVHLEARH
jgi:hypothetical protein